MGEERNNKKKRRGRSGEEMTLRNGRREHGGDKRIGISFEHHTRYKASQKYTFAYYQEFVI